MESIKFNNKDYYTVKYVYTNLGVARNAVIKKLERLEETGDVLRMKNKRSEIYISQNGYNKLKEERIKYLDEEITKASTQNMKEYYQKFKDAIEKPELWEKYHSHISMVTLYAIHGKVIAQEVKCNGKKVYINYKTSI